MGEGLGLGTLFEQLVSESDVKDVVEALQRPFFMGQVIFTSDTQVIGQVVHPSALTEDRIKRRLQDERFCQFCFCFIPDRHEYDCRKSPWKC